MNVAEGQRSCNSCVTKLALGLKRLDDLLMVGNPKRGNSPIFASSVDFVGQAGNDEFAARVNEEGSVGETGVAEGA